MGNTQGEKPTLRKQISKEVRMALAFGIPNIVTFAGVLASSSNYAPCTHSSETYQWAYVHWIYSIVNLAISCLIVPLFMIQADRMEKNVDVKGVKKWNYLKAATKLCLLLVSFIVYFGNCYAYSTGENCSHLTQLILSFIIIFPIVFVVIFALITYRVIKKKKEDKQKLEEKNEAGLLDNEERGNV